LVLTPDFEQLELPEELKDEEQKETYTESYHLDGVEEGIVSVYNKIKDEMLRIDPQIRVNPQKYYISLRRNKNFAFLQIRRKKIRIVVMLPFETSPTMIKLHKVTQLSEVVQKFYNGPCFQVLLENESDLDEIIQVLKQAYAAQVR
jgi:predicted transport protein